MNFERSWFGGYMLGGYHITQDCGSYFWRVEKGITGGLLYEDKRLENCIEWILEQEEE